jgi:glucose dehydrogenase
MTKEAKKNVLDLATVAAVVVGLCLVVRGVWLAWRPGGWIVAGLVMAVPALLHAYASFRGK